MYITIYHYISSRFNYRSLYIYIYIFIYQTYIKYISLYITPYHVYFIILYHWNSRTIESIMPCCSRMIGTTPFPVGSILDFLRVGARTNWWGLGCPSHCGPSAVHSLILAFIAGLGFGLSIGLLAIPLLAMRLGFVLSVIPHHHPFSADPRPHRLPSSQAASGIFSPHGILVWVILIWTSSENKSVKFPYVWPRWNLRCQTWGNPVITAPQRTLNLFQRFRGRGALALAVALPSRPPAGTHLRTSLKRGKLSFKERAERAWSAGNWAKFVPQGRISKPRPTTRIDLANSVYVILKAKGITRPVRAERASDYRAWVGDFTGESLAHSCV